MNYLYVCDKCNKEITIEKPAQESGREEYCPSCNSVLRREYRALTIRTGDGNNYASRK